MSLLWALRYDRRVLPRSLAIRGLLSAIGSMCDGGYERDLQSQTYCLDQRGSIAAVSRNPGPHAVSESLTLLHSSLAWSAHRWALRGEDASIAARSVATLVLRLFLLECRETQEASLFVQHFCANQRLDASQSRFRHVPRRSAIAAAYDDQVCFYLSLSLKRLCIMLLLRIFNVHAFFRIRQRLDSIGDASRSRISASNSDEKCAAHVSFRSQGEAREAHLSSSTSHRALASGRITREDTARSLSKPACSRPRS